jgi:hypothetical protein
LLADYRGAAQLAQGNDVPRAAFYGLLREGLPHTLAALSSQSALTLKGALLLALGDNLIPAALAELVDRIVALLRGVASQVASQVPPAQSIPALLATSIKDATTQQAFISAYTTHQGSIQSFWTPLGQKCGAEAGERYHFRQALALLIRCDRRIVALHLLREMARDRSGHHVPHFGAPA